MSPLLVSAELDYLLLRNVAIVVISGLLILKHILGGRLALLVCFVKGSILLLYFGFFVVFDWWLEGDSNGFIKNALFLLEVWEKKDSFRQVLLMSTRLDQPAAYVLHNLLSFKLFGEVFYAPIFLNTVLVFVGGALLMSILRSVIAEEKFRRVFVVVFLLHPATISWSTFNNVKEVLVLVSILSLTRVTQVLLSQVKGGLKNWGALLATRRWRPHGRETTLLSNKLIVIARLGFCGTVIIGAYFVVDHTRHYLVFLWPMIFLLWLSFEGVIYGIGLKRANGASLRKVFFTIFIIGLLGGTSVGLIIYLIPNAIVNHINFSTAAIGIVKFLLTPRPWSLDAEYEFLLASATLHWLFLGWTIFGMVFLARSATGRWLLALCVCSLVVFGSTPEVAGPRHRFSTDFVFLLAQFLVWKMLIEEVLCKPRSPNEGY